MASMWRRLRSSFLRLRLKCTTLIIRAYLDGLSKLTSIAISGKVESDLPANTPAASNNHRHRLVRHL